MGGQQCPWASGAALLVSPELQALGGSGLQSFRNLPIVCRVRDVGRLFWDHAVLSIRDNSALGPESSNGWLLCLGFMKSWGLLLSGVPWSLLEEMA